MRSEPSTYSRAVDAVAIHIGEQYDDNARYSHTVSVEVEGVAVPLGIDVDAEGHILMIEVLAASRAFTADQLAALKQVD